MKNLSQYLQIPPILLLILLSQQTAAEIFRWTDENGRVQFGDRPPLRQQATRVQVKINTYQAPSIETLTGATAQASRVVMYSASWCGVCKKAKAYFEREKIRYAEYDIETSDRGKREFAKLNAKGVPVILVGRKRMNGFSVASFEKIYR